MLKTAIITDEISQDLDTALALAKEFSLDGVEIRSVWDKSPFVMTKEDGEKILEKVTAAGMKICAISAPFFKCSLDNADEISTHIKGLENCIMLAKLWGVSIIRGFAFWRLEDIDSRLLDIVEKFQKPIAMMKEAGMILALESDPSVNTMNATELSRMIQAIDSPQVKALWDPGNNLYAPIKERPYPEGYSAIKDVIVHVHLKDAIWDSEQNAIGCCFGEGLVDFEGQFSALNQDNYDGWIVMETHYRLDAAIDEELLKRPGGSAFSADGYQPSRRCLIAMQKLLSRFS